MAKNNNLQDLLRSISDVLRAAEGSTALINPQDYDNKIAEHIVDAPSVHSWADTRSTADGGTIKDGIAYVKALRGKSVKVNQLADNGNFASSDGWYNITSVAENVGKRTCTSSEQSYNTIWRSMSWIQGHKYLLIADVRLSYASNVNFGTQYSYPASTAISANTWTTLTCIITATANDANLSRLCLFYNRSSSATSGATVEMRRCLAIDLTDIGKESLTANGVAEYLGYADAASMPYIAYQPTTIVLNCKQKSVKSASRNLWDSDAKIKIADTTMAYDAKKAVFLKAGNYAVSWEVSGATSWRLCLALFDGNGNKDLTRGTMTKGYSLTNIITWTANGTGKVGYINIKEDSFVMLGLAFGDVSASTIVSSVQVERGNTVTDYSKYFAPDTLTLPTLTAFPNGLCGVGTAYDEVDLATGKATKRFACKVLNGSEDWSLQSVNASGIANFLTYFSDMKQAYAESILTICDLPRQSTGIASTTDEGYFPQSNTACYFRILSSKASSVSALKTYLASHPITIVYELATAEESTFTPQRAYYKASNNGQEVASAEEATAPFTAEIGYKEPTATELVNALNG